jgi:hypothetical protein|tara:strand:+ start:1608 stop:2174 length:567 start_codon:yes stop_codon:yes gene_type:complete
MHAMPYSRDRDRVGHDPTTFDNDATDDREHRRLGRIGRNRDQDITFSDPLYLIEISAHARWPGYHASTRRDATHTLTIGELIIIKHLLATDVLRRLFAGVVVINSAARPNSDLNILRTHLVFFGDQQFLQAEGKDVLLVRQQATLDKLPADCEMLASSATRPKFNVYVSKATCRISFILRLEMSLFCG